MAEKITLEEFEKRQKKKKHMNVVLIILLILSVVCNAVFITLYILEVDINKENELVGYQDSNSSGSFAENVIRGKEERDALMKAGFLDENIVFVIEGFGDYYYTYDCMMEKVGDNQYTYWAYNRENAIYLGYREGSCD